VKKLRSTQLVQAQANPGKRVSAPTPPKATSASSSEDWEEF
jgi:hypothetical protein